MLPCSTLGPSRSGVGLLEVGGAAAVMGVFSRENRASRVMVVSLVLSKPVWLEINAEALPLAVRFISCRTRRVLSGMNHTGNFGLSCK